MEGESRQEALLWQIDVTYELVPHGSGVALQVSADPAWIQDPARNWQVTIDPTIGAFPDDSFVAENFNTTSQRGRICTSVGTSSRRAATSTVRSSTSTRPACGASRSPPRGWVPTSYYSHVCSVDPGPVYPIFEQWKKSAIQWPGPSSFSGLAK